MGMESKADRAKGRLKEAGGDLTGDRELRREGQADQAGADVKEKVEQAKDKATDAIDAAKRKLT